MPTAPQKVASAGPDQAPQFRIASYRATPAAQPADAASDAHMARYSPNSSNGERRVRGPRHRQPVLLRFTALIHLLTRLAFVTSVVGLPIILLAEPSLLSYALICPVVLVLSGLVWIILCSKVGCRVCAMRMFQNKRCAKSRKAPSWPILGPHTTMAVLALFSKSVRCPYCGTPNELNDRDE